MPRASFSDVSKGGLGFKEGRILVLRSFSTMFQFPPNSKTNEQSDAFPALVWEGLKLNDEGKVVEDAEGNQEEVQVIHRMGGKDESGNYAIRPGKLAEKDFDNTDVEPEDLGGDVDPDVKGNSFYVDAGAKFSMGWGFIDDSLKKHGFKADILGRCVTTDFVGLDAHFKQQEGAPYIAKKGAKKGQEIKPENLVCSRIFHFPYDKDNPHKAALAGGGKTATGKKDDTKADKKGAGAGADSGSGGGSTDAFEAAKIIFGGGKHALLNKGEEINGLSDLFFKSVPKDKEVKMDDFRKAVTSELMRRKADLKLQKAIMDEVVKNEDKLTELAAWLMENDKQTFSTDGKIVQFTAA